LHVGISLSQGQELWSGWGPSFLPFILVLALQQPERANLWPDGHFAYAIAILARDGEGLSDAVDGTGVGENGREPIGVRLEEVEGLSGFVIGAADVEDGQLFAAHGGDVHGNNRRGGNAGENDAAGIARKLNCLAGGVGPGGAVEGAINAAPGGGLKDFFGGFGGIERGVSSDLAGKLAAVRKGLNGPDATCVGGAQGGDGEKADGTGAYDGYGFAGAEGSELEGMHGDGKRLGEGGCIAGHARGDGQKIPGREVDELTEEAGDAGITEEANVRANVVMATEAELAVIAVERGLESAAVAGSEAGDAGASFDDDARRLMAEDHGVKIGRAADGAFGPSVQIRAADADRFDADLNFAGGGAFDRHLDELEAAWGNKFGGAHGHIP